MHLDLLSCCDLYERCSSEKTVLWGGSLNSTYFMSGESEDTIYEMVCCSPLFSCCGTREEPSLTSPDGLLVVTFFLNLIFARVCVCVCLFLHWCR